MKNKTPYCGIVTHRRILLVVVCALLWSAQSDGADALHGPGKVPPGGFRSPEGDMRFTAEKGAKPLNNMVFELLNIESPGVIEYTFRNPREGWVYIRVPKPEIGTDSLPAATLDGQKVALKAVGEYLEAMRYICQGTHAVGIVPGNGPVARMEVRAIGELFYAAYGANPHILETGNYNWQFLRRNVLDHYNSIIGDNPAETDIKEWTDQGKRWFSLHPLPWSDTADEAYDYWAQTRGMQHPLMSGIWADEFGPWEGERNGKTVEQMYSVWTNALRRISANPEFKGRKFYAYVYASGPGFWPVEQKGRKEMFSFVQTLMDSGYRLGPEWYLSEKRSKPGMIINNAADLRADRESFERAIRGAATNRVMILSILSEPGWENGDLYPDYNFNVLLDRQFQFMATDPSFFGLRGVQGYLSSYCGEEQVRLFAALVRHYCIEGRTDLMLKDPYVLTHLQNPAFEDGLNGWTVTPAVSSQAQASVAVKTATGFGILQAKYQGPKGLGDIAMWTKRSSEKPNVISQQVRDLVPGRLYSLRFITGDYQELLGGKSVRRKHAISVKIENTEPLAEKHFQAVTGAGHNYSFGPFVGPYNGNPYWMNYHQHVFRAKGKTARLILSDWASEGPAGGAAGTELIWNFIQLQPYFE